MKTFYIRLTASEAIDNAYFQVELPDYFNSDIVKQIIDSRTRYDVRVTELPLTIKPVYIKKKSMERLIDAVIETKLYKKGFVRTVTDKIEQSIPFSMPYGMSVKTSYELRDHETVTLTFFEPRTILLGEKFNMPCSHSATKKYLMDELKIKESCIGRFYLVGKWEILKRALDPIEKDDEVLEHYMLVKYAEENTVKAVEI